METGMNKVGCIRKTIGILLIFCGILAIFLPKVQALKVQKDQADTIQKFQEEKINAPGNEGRENRVLWEQICQYNREIYENGQKEFADIQVAECRPKQLQAMEDDLFGYIEIPAMACRLPLYLGASDENLRYGATVLGGTSVPIGGKNTNSVIAGHRGWKKNKFFKEIEKLTPGDVVYVTNLWETLVYRVECIDVIEPFDSEKVKIQEEKDMITLLTCHPYCSGGRYRYAVYCVRDEIYDCTDS